jgi:hypothetical protein
LLEGHRDRRRNKELDPSTGEIVGLEFWEASSKQQAAG